jgi:hypothetical protein
MCITNLLNSSILSQSLHERKSYIAARAVLLRREVSRCDRESQTDRTLIVLRVDEPEVHLTSLIYLFVDQVHRATPELFAACNRLLTCLLEKPFLTPVIDVLSDSIEDH